MKVLHAISGITRANGGPAVALAGLAKAQAKTGLETTVFATWVDQPSDQEAADLQAAGVHVERLGPCRNPMSRHPDLPATLEKLIRQADVVHIHAMWEAVQYHAARLCRKLGKPYILTPHGMLDPWNMQTSWLKKRLYLRLFMWNNLQQAAAIHVCAEQERLWVARLGLRPQLIREPLGISLEEFQTLPPRGTFRARHPELADRPYVMFLGRIHRGKGWETLIPAMRGTTPANALAVIAGPDSAGFRREAEMMAQQHDVADRVLFTGPLYGAERLAALVDASLFVLPSCHENFSMATLEAMACGTPAIVSDQVGLGDELKRSGAGEVVPLEGGDWANAISTWLAQPEKLAAASAKARSAALGGFAWEAIAIRWGQHYRRVLESSEERSQ